jgi:hypothetical protein
MVISLIRQAKELIPDTSVTLSTAHSPRDQSHGNLNLLRAEMHDLRNLEHVKEPRAGSQSTGGQVS